MNDESVGVAYRIEDLAHHSGATVRTIRAYQDRGLLPRPERRGRANVYSDTHLARLRQIAGLLDRGYTLASIKELLEAWDAGRGLGGVLGLVAETDGPWTDEEATRISRISRTELDEWFGGLSDGVAVADAIELGVLEPVPGQDDMFLVPSPQELAVAAELHAAGIPLPALSDHLRELRGQVEHIASRFLEFPELARATRLFAHRHLRHHLGSEQPVERTDETRSVPVPVPVLVPAATMRAVEALVGAERAAEFVAIAAEREVQARTLDSLTANHTKRHGFDETSRRAPLKDEEGP